VAGEKDAKSGRLKIDDHWNVINIIALSQNNPLKAITDFVANSMDDGAGISDFHCVATHIGDSVKREFKREGEQGLQGEFGLGLLSFWTLGDTCTLTSAGAAGVARSMKLVTTPAARRGLPGYTYRKAPG
jgi:hypothetical protein